MENTLYVRIINTQQEIENDFIFQKLGNIWPFVEMSIGPTAQEVSRNSYRGGSWEFVELENEGWFMRPDNPQEKFIVYNWENKPVEVSNDTFGIIVCEYIFSELAFYFENKGQENHMELMDEYYHKLREYYIEHSPESSKIHDVLDKLI